SGPFARRERRGPDPFFSSGRNGLRTPQGLQVRGELRKALDPARLGARAPLLQLGEQALVARVRAFPQRLQLRVKLENAFEVRMLRAQLREPLEGVRVEHVRLPAQPAPDRPHDAVRVLAERLDLAA